MPKAASRFSSFLEKQRVSRVKPLHKHALRAGQPLYDAGAHRPLLIARYVASACPLRADHFRRRVNHLRIAELLDYRAVAHAGTESQVNRLRVNVDPIS